MKRILPVIAVLASCCLFTTGCHQSAKDYSKQYFADFSSAAFVKKYGEIPISHCWRDLQEKDYLFGIPSPDSIASWKKLCEERNPSSTVDLYYLKGEYQSINQYVTYSDLVELWYNSDSRKLNDDLTLWRLTQYITVRPALTTEAARFDVLEGMMGSVLDFDAQSQWDLNFRSGVEAGLVECYERVLARTAADSAATEVAVALRDEQQKWEAYHALLDSSYRIITCRPDGMDGSAAPMSFAGIMVDDAEARSTSLKDYYFTVADGQLKYTPARHRKVTISLVNHEMSLFINTIGMQDPEDHYPKVARIIALEKEFYAWCRWMESRDRVSALLSGSIKDVYDNATNNLRRHKLIMYRNRYEGYGVISDEIYRKLTRYDIDDEAFDALFPYRRWKGHQE